ncbi:tRNA (adenosine(37)-N6)-threonylcarbamoyltransferase complex ATPase subunit type 1 TsaE [Sphingobacterium griseoflavum]|uniref:tRNA threonylcarbamoyladenosine biosynthesis protein TsaE n=1 Tax=Sphingobacterium griseoflavum TaxID=1474952 RepID=A0ABQ3I006_9SPHI|nr:tRNA (adenosine(37)-N6)-threonylcarbamoyltransferase complex ATPase subunit type 1 TsaE [Sphingobacterium griseoflavum]GHE37257.1 tRNA (adenosine(37)-N6)-threonylcarbamoyltransferase complex ATPase subunit type 1 TsaE [Sphingobacterium griseoflavum]
MEIHVNNLEELPAAARKILSAHQNDRIFLLKGQMGAGKTTLVHALCTELGVTEATSSPTFSIVNEYDSPSGPIFHFDFYRLKKEEEALDLGYEDYFYSDSYCFVEWPEKIPNLIPHDAREVSIEIISPSSRKIILK